MCVCLSVKQARCVRVRRPLRELILTNLFLYVLYYYFYITSNERKYAVVIYEFVLFYSFRMNSNTLSHKHLTTQKRRSWLSLLFHSKILMLLTVKLSKFILFYDAYMYFGRHTSTMVRLSAISYVQISQEENCGVKMMCMRFFGCQNKPLLLFIVGKNTVCSLQRVWLQRAPGYNEQFFASIRSFKARPSVYW